jgi:hypothetical protein
MSNDDFLGSSGTPLKFEKIGDIHQGKLVRIVERTDTDMDGKPKTWDDGTPKKVWIWELEQENGETGSMWVRSNLVTALREASKKAGAKTQGDLIGATVMVKHHAVGEAKKGFPPKLFQAKITLAPKSEAQEYDPFAE